MSCRKLNILTFQVKLIYELLHGPSTGEFDFLFVSKTAQVTISLTGRHVPYPHIPFG